LMVLIRMLLGIVGRFLGFCPDAGRFAWFAT